MRSKDFSKIVARGENPNGVVQQTSNGTVIDGAGGDGFQYNWGDKPDGARWNNNPMPQNPFNEPYNVVMPTPSRGTKKK